MSVAALFLPGLYGGHISTGLQSGDAVAPVYTVGPTAGAVGDTYLQITATITDTTPPITFYGVVVADAAGAPSAAQIKAGTDSADSAAPSNSVLSVTSGDTFSLQFAGLTAATAYDVYYVASDSFSNDATPAKLDMTTAAVETFDPQDTVQSARRSMVQSMISDIN
jgi:hypothetical protein